MGTTETSPAEDRPGKARRIVWGVVSGVIAGFAAAILEFFATQEWIHDSLGLMAGLAVAAFIAVIVWLREWRLFAIFFVGSALFSYFVSFFAIVVAVYLACPSGFC